MLEVRDKRKAAALKAIRNIATSYRSIAEQGEDWLSRTRYNCPYQKTTDNKKRVIFNCFVAADLE